MEDNLLNSAVEISDNCVSPVQNRVVAKFSELPIWVLVIWICRNTRKKSRCSRYEGFGVEETMLAKVRGFIDDAKKECLHSLHECLRFSELPKSFHFSSFDDDFTWNNICRRFRKISKTGFYRRHVCLSVYPHGTTQLPLDSFSWNLIFGYFSKICRENLCLTEVGEEKRALFLQSNVLHFL